MFPHYKLSVSYQKMHLFNKTGNLPLALAQSKVMCIAKGRLPVIFTVIYP